MITLSAMILFAITFIVIVYGVYFVVVTYPCLQRAIYWNDKGLYLDDFDPIELPTVESWSDCTYPEIPKGETKE